MYNLTAPEALSEIFGETQLKLLNSYKFYYCYCKCEDDFIKKLPSSLVKEFENLVQIVDNYYFYYQENFEVFLFETLKAITNFKPTKKCKN